MKFKIREEEIMRRVMEYEIEADSIEEAREIAHDPPDTENEYFPLGDDSILITINDEQDEEVWSGDYTELEG